MTRKRFINLIMAEGYDRNYAHDYARHIQSLGISYDQAYVENLLGHMVLRAIERRIKWNIVCGMKKSKSENVKKLWGEFGDVPMNPETECIETDWNGFPAGTHREDIWHWFEETFGIAVHDLLY